MSKEDEGLHACLPVREIPRGLLTEYNDGASTAKTPIEEIKHFLPRYLDLVWDFDFPSHSLELSLKRLAPFEESEWTVEELKYLERFSKAFFDKCLSAYPLPENEDILGVLIMFWRGQLDVNLLLGTWLHHNGAESALHYRDLVFGGFEQHNPSMLSNAFAEPQITNILREWAESNAAKEFFSKEIEKLVLKGEAMKEKDLEELSLLYEMIVAK
ncbi:MAG: hypothetical protein ACO1OQ_15135 [Rufibacter sp.]